jgi:integrase/recombinase XerD
MNLAAALTRSPLERASMATTNSILIFPKSEPVFTLDRFVNHLYARCGLAPSTIDLATGYIRRMLPHTGPHPTQDALDQVIGKMRREGTSYGNLTNAMRAIEHYMAFLGEPIHFGRPRKPIKAELKILTEGKIARMFVAAHGLRETALLAVMAYTGMRNNELVNLLVSDVDVPQQSITIQSGKGARGRVACMSGECAEVIIEYLRERRGEPEDFLFVTVRNKHKLQTQDVRKFCRVLAKRAGVSGRVWPHLFRHSLATMLLDRGANIYSIQAILGHADVQTTMDNYLHPSARNTKADYHRCVPSFL